MPSTCLGQPVERPVTLQALVRALVAHGDRPAILAFHKQTIETWSYAKLSDTVARLAAGLLDAGLSKGEPVAIYSPNRPEWIVACLAMIRTGAVPVPLDSQMAHDDLAHVLQDCAARWIMTIRSLADRLATHGLDQHRTVILLDAEEHEAGSWRRIRGDPTRPIPSVRAEEHALLFYTSGVSGRPKGVPLSHRNLLANLQALLQVRVYRPDERLFLPLPLHHVYPFMIGLLAPFALGRPIILPHSLTGPQTLRTLRDGAVTAIVGVPRLYAGLYEAIDQRVRRRGWPLAALFRTLLAGSALLLRYGHIRLGPALFARLRAQIAPQLRTLVSGGSALAPELAWRLAGLGWHVAGGFGLTETSPILTVVPPGSHYIDTAGKPLPGVRIRIADRDSQTGQGEIQAQGENVFGGYLHLPHKTAEAFTEDGWFKTGDLGYIDAAGCLHIVGRASSRITLPGGEKIWPERIEELLDGTASIRESAVLMHNGRLVGVIVPRVGSPDANAMIQLKRVLQADVETSLRPLPSYSRLTDFTVSFDPLPRTRLGKLQRHKLAALFLACQRQIGGADARPIAIDAMAPEDRQLLEDPVALQTWNWLIERFPTVRLTPDTHMSLELGIDSLEWMTISLALNERVGIELPEEAIGRVATVRDLLREAVEAEQAAGTAADPATQLAEPDSLLDENQRRWLTKPGRIMQNLGTALVALDRLLMRAAFDLEVQGAERLPPQGPYVLAPNHASLLDPPALIAVLPVKILRETYWGGWTGIMFRNPIMRLVSRATLVLPIDQRGKPLANLALGAAALARGHNLVWFPEGGRSRDGTLQPFQAGIGMLLTAYPVPVVPVRITGSFEALPTGAWWPRRTRIRITFGDAVDPHALAGSSQGAARYRRIAAALRERVAGLNSPLTKP